jgi:hypothetical protein
MGLIGKKRSHNEPCTSCNRTIKEGQKVCECGTATRFMDFEERTEHEVQQWRTYRARTA